MNDPFLYKRSKEGVVGTSEFSFFLPLNSSTGWLLLLLSPLFVWVARRWLMWMATNPTSSAGNFHITIFFTMLLSTLLFFILALTCTSSHLLLTLVAYTSPSVTAAAPAFDIDWSTADDNAMNQNVVNGRAQPGHVANLVQHHENKAKVESAKDLGRCIAHDYAHYLTCYFAYPCSQ